MHDKVEVANGHPRTRPSLMDVVGELKARAEERARRQRKRGDVIEANGTTVNSHHDDDADDDEQIRHRRMSSTRPTTTKKPNAPAFLDALETFVARTTEETDDYDEEEEDDAFVSAEEEVRSRDAVENIGSGWREPPSAEALRRRELRKRLARALLSGETEMVGDEVQDVQPTESSSRPHGASAVATQRKRTDVCNGHQPNSAMHDGHQPQFFLNSEYGGDDGAMVSLERDSDRTAEQRARRKKMKEKRRVRLDVLEMDESARIHFGLDSK